MRCASIYKLPVPSRAVRQIPFWTHHVDNKISPCPPPLIPPPSRHSPVPPHLSDHHATFHRWWRKLFAEAPGTNGPDTKRRSPGPSQKKKMSHMTKSTNMRNERYSKHDLLRCDAAEFGGMTAIVGYSIPSKKQWTTGTINEAGNQANIEADKNITSISMKDMMSTCHAVHV